MLPTNPKAELARLDAIIRLGATVQQRTPWSYTVASQSEEGVRHAVVFDGQGRAHCSCISGQVGRACKHVAATLFWLEMNQQQTEQRAA